MPRYKRSRSSSQKANKEAVVRSTRTRIPLALALILLTTFVVYLPAMRGGRLWDDDAHITRPALQSLAGLGRIWFQVGATQQYYPMLHSAFWLEHKLWGESMLGYHLVNVLWHLVAASLVYFILVKLKIPGALLATAIFALHPVMVESVAWVTEQKNTLSAVFYLSAMLAYLAFDQQRKRSHYLFALGLFTLGLLTKTVTATLPAALLVIFWWQRGTINVRRDVLPLIPFFVLGAAAGLTTAWLERTQIGAEGSDFDLSFLARSLLAGRVIWFYLGKLVWPTDLLFIYPRWTIDPAQAWQWIFPISAIALTIALAILYRRWRAPLAGWLFFCGTLFPVLGFLNVYPFVFSFVADHFQYLASLGVIVLAAAGITKALARLPVSARRAGVAIPIVLSGALAGLSWRQAHMYANSIALYQATLKDNPNCFLAHNNLGLALEQKGLRDQSVEHYRAALRLKPDYPEAHFNLGNWHVSAGNLPAAIDLFREAVRLDPNFVEAHQNLGDSLANAGRFTEAIGEYHAVLLRWRNNPHALNNLSFALAQVGRVAEAIECLKESLRLRPDHVEALNNLGRLMIHSGDAKDAVPYLERALQLRPDSADIRNNLADALRETGQYQNATEQYQSAIRLQRDFLQAYAGLAQAFAGMGRFQEAAATAQQGIDLAQSAGQQELLSQLQQWLADYRAKLQSGADAPRSQPPTSKRD
jgi:tetratricopeptide (TPR) repeat protein